MEQENATSLKYRITTFIQESMRVLKVSKRPDSTEFKTIVKVAGLGILAIGLIGFLIQISKSLIFG